VFVGEKRHVMAAGGTSFWITAALK
jgi:hypothetical protein